MRIREILFHNFRSFRGERRISFVDPLTDAVRPVSVLAGSNGSGKTTVLDVIDALLQFVERSRPGTRPVRPHLVDEALETGLICLALELSAADLATPDRVPHLSGNRGPEIMHIVVGRRELAPRSPEKEWPNLFCYLVPQDSKRKPYIRRTPLAKQLQDATLPNHRKETEQHGGLLYFPHDRQLGSSQGGPAEPPSKDPPWSFRFLPTDSWQGSLEQLWVCQNYLDLEQRAKGAGLMVPIKVPMYIGRNRLKPFVEVVEEVLGEGRTITIEEGRVWVPVSWKKENGEAPRVRLGQLPSGEQQVLLLFGELAHRRRKGVVIAIDEVEESLHPTFQRLVMWNLQRLARQWDAQVIVATHSLEITNTVRGGAFINLDYPEDRFDLPIPDDDEEVAQ